MLPTAIIDSRVLALAYALLVYGVMFAFAAALVRRGAPRRLTSSTQGRVGCLDGLRGILALGVFIGHSIVAYRWSITGRWTGDDLNSVLVELGRSAVALFFMITGFLFTRKTLRPVHWLDFYRRRMGRIAPLYFLTVVIVVAIVFASTAGELKEPAGLVAQEIARWLIFGVFRGEPDINGYANTFVINAGVNWSLKFEVRFYLLWVPALALVNRFLASPLALLAALVALLGMVTFQELTNHEHFGNMLFYEHFLGGILVAYAYETAIARRLIEATWFHWFGAMAAVALMLTLDPGSARGVLLAVIVFAAVAGGASIFGLLRTRPALWLGDISYGVYLLHGLVLWFAYKTIRAPASLGGFVVFSLVVGAIAVVVATLSYLLVELPAMRLANPRGANGSTAVVPA